MDDLLHPVRNLSWGNGPSYAYLWNDQGTNTIFVRMDGQEDLTRLPWPGPIRTYTFSGDCLYVAGSVGKDPAGLYRFDIKNKALALIVSSLRQPLQYAKLVPPVDGVFTNGAGTLATYHVWRPANFSPHQKYPVILCQTPYIWTPFPQIAANAGYYYALVDRPSWSDGLTRWCDDVAGLYNVMVKDPNVDPERVFLYGASAETGYIHQFVSEKPDSCRGLIFFSAAVPPPLSGTRLSSMVLIIGQDEGPAVVQRWKKYQNDAAEQGIRVSLDFESGAQHISRSIATERDRARQLAKYLEEN